MFLNRLLLFIMALCLGSLLVRMHLPIPFLLGGLLTALLCKTLTHRSDVPLQPTLGITFWLSWLV